MSLCACWGYARCGLLAPHDARTVALCALPRSQHAAGECPPALAETSRVQAQCSAVQWRAWLLRRRGAVRRRGAGAAAGRAAGAGAGAAAGGRGAGAVCDSGRRIYSVGRPPIL